MNATGKMLKRLIAKNATASGNWDKSVILSTIPGKSRDLSSFLKAVEMEDWRSLNGFHQWNPEEDSVVAFLLRGEPQCAVAVVYSPSELYATEKLLYFAAISADFGNIASKFGKWETIDLQ